MAKGICTQPGCGKLDFIVHGWCQTHYVQLRHQGQQCLHLGCQKVPRALGLCERHYREHRLAGALCSIDDCTSVQLHRGLCQRHARQSSKACGHCGLLFWADLRTVYCSPACRRNGRHVLIGRSLGYSGAHSRVKSLRGPARDHPCVDCGASARDWSYKYGDPDEMVESTETGHQRPYSLNPDYYQARCEPCHGAYDALHGYRPRGHQINQSRLVADEVREIRTAYAAGGIGSRVLARQYGVTKKTIMDVARRRSWAWLD